MKSKQKVLSATQSNADDNHKQESTTLIEVQEIPGTPFKMVKDLREPPNKYFISMGDYRITEPTNSEEETLQKLVTEHWRIIATIVSIVVEQFNARKEAAEALPYESESL